MPVTPHGRLYPCVPNDDERYAIRTPGNMGNERGCSESGPERTVRPYSLLVCQYADALPVLSFPSVGNKQ